MAAENIVEQLTERFACGSESDVWTQGDVYRLVFLPLCEELARRTSTLEEANHLLANALTLAVSTSLAP